MAITLSKPNGLSDKALAELEKFDFDQTARSGEAQGTIDLQVYETEGEGDEKINYVKLQCPGIGSYDQTKWSAGNFKAFQEFLYFKTNFEAWMDSKETRKANEGLKEFKQGLADAEAMLRSHDELKNIALNTAVLEGTPGSTGPAGSKGTQILTNVTGQYDVGTDWNNDVYTMNMWRVGGETSTIYRVEVTFNVDGMSDTGYEGAARWVFIINASHKSADDRIQRMGLDPTGIDAKETESFENFIGWYDYENDSDQDGAFIVPEDTKTDNDNVIWLSSIVGLQYTANPYWSYNTNESVTTQQMYIRLNSILDEIAMANKDGGAAKGFSDVWMGKTTGGISNSSANGTPPTPAVPPAGPQASTGTAAPAEPAPAEPAPAEPAPAEPAPAAPTVVPPANNGEVIAPPPVDEVESPR